ncbi:hypothetical protein C7435_2533 [Maricaulis maris]|uniref:Uncharacterized protein n=1 Tax=Maricaulis maris TaxID=74318 RepID=A0A495D4F3_9PROT|nr:hypothetical protein C7435_2533 [Maricaulis maris]
MPASTRRIEDAVAKRDENDRALMGCLNGRCDAVPRMVAGTRRGGLKVEALRCSDCGETWSRIHVN